MSPFHVVFITAFTFITIEVASGSSPITNKSTIIDCKRRPADLRSVQFCCEVKIPKLGFYQADCIRSLTEKRSKKDVLARKDVICFIECVANVSNAVVNSELNLPALKELLTHAYSDIELVDALYKSFEDCTVLLKHKVADYMRALNTGSKKIGKCSPLPLLYVVCSEVMLMKHCPKNLWHHNQHCDLSRSYVENCDQAVFQWASVKEKKTKKTKPSPVKNFKSH